MLFPGAPYMTSGPVLSLLGASPGATTPIGTNLWAKPKTISWVCLYAIAGGGGARLDPAEVVRGGGTLGSGERTGPVDDAGPNGRARWVVVRSAANQGGAFVVDRFHDGSFTRPSPPAGSGRAERWW